MSKIIDAPVLMPALDSVLRQSDHRGLFFITDSNVRDAVVSPLLNPLIEKYSASIICFEAGEKNKNLDTLANVWQSLCEGGASRKSLVINIGGGVVTDLGGFAAATFKRGISFINVPTSVLGAVDAAVGGKTGIDFNGFKNEIGAFSMPEAVIISPQPLSTLPIGEIISGYGEIVKMALLSSEDFYRLAISENIIEDKTLLGKCMSMSVREKERIVAEDPKESGLRKVLNLGHTAGHAFETMMLEKGKPVSHGVAIANGLLVSLILSHMLLGLSSDEIYRYSDNVLREHFPVIPITCKDYDRLEDIIGHDKKNPAPGDIRFVLLEAVGSPRIDIPVLSPDLRSAFDIYRDLVI